MTDTNINTGAEIPSLTRMCLEKVVQITGQESNFHPKAIKELCKLIPNSLLIPLFDILQERSAVTDVILLLSLVPNRTRLSLPASLHIKNATLKQIGYNCPYLVSLDISDCVQVSNSVVRIVLQGCPKLSEIKLDRCHRVTDAAFDMTESPFEALVGCLSLEAISLQGCPQITGEIVTTLNKLCGRLKYLNLSQCKQIHSRAITQVFEHNQLLSLNLAFLDLGCVTDESFLSFPVMLHSKQMQAKSPLRKLNLGKSTISDVSMHRMGFLSDLVEIRLQWCQGITDAGIKALITNCPSLRLIDLKSCLITDEAVMSIARESKNLKVLDLSWCSKLTNASIGYLVAYQHCHASSSKVSGGIETLYLVWCSNLTDAGVSFLREVSSLKTVDLSGCMHIGKGCADSLVASGIQVIQ